MNGVAFLIFTRADYAPALPGRAAKLLVIFLKKLQAYAANPVYVCAQAENLSATLLGLTSAAKPLIAKSELEAVRSLFNDVAIQHVAIFNGIYPLLDRDETQKLFQIHREYRADISYAENLPPGLTPYFVSRDLLESLDIMEARDEDVVAVGLRAFVEKNINSFHAEVHYEEPDLRLMRLDFSLASRRSLLKTQAFIEKTQHLEAPYAGMHDLIKAHPELLHTFPSYIELEFCTTASNKNYFSPLSYIEQQPHTLTRENFDRVKEYLATGLGDTSVCASGLGEPLEHPQAVEFVSELLSDANLRNVFVETNGEHLDKLLPLATHASADKLRVIVMLNSLKRFSELAGAPAAMLEKVKMNMRALTQALHAAGKKAAEIVYLQVLKVEENETEIDELYALAEELGATFLLQKYNRYAGLMPERRVSDMTPLERYACWHLRRDLFIRANGDVAHCKQTVDQTKNTARGNLARNSLAELWLGQRADFVANFQEKYPSHLPCATCDEYFTFNF
ncbi:MAG: spiro-SPASM protein [Spirochaetes bacterium]|nr:spiro-SPASM protein [Spirochaetota bacterium]